MQTSESDLIVGFYFEPSAEHHAMFAWSDSTQTEEVVFLLRMLETNHMISLGEQSPIPDVVVQPRGYEQAASASERGSSAQAFVAMWFDPSMREIYELGIEAAVRESGYRPLRIDQKEHVNKIDDEIIAEIKRSQFLIADFTAQPGCPRGGVYFEAGYALALGKPVIWTCREDVIGEVHFDTRQFNHIVWRNAGDLKVRLKNRIAAVLGDGPFRQ
jgi:nucleoside 2-deoxyribosyltransferase